MLTWMLGIQNKEGLLNSMMLDLQMWTGQDDVNATCSHDICESPLVMIQCHTNKPVHLGHPDPLTLFSSSLSLLTADLGTEMKPILTSICFLLLYSSFRVYKQSVSYRSPSIILPASVPSGHIVWHCWGLCFSAAKSSQLTSGQ